MWTSWIILESCIIGDSAFKGERLACANLAWFRYLPWFEYLPYFIFQLTAHFACIFSCWPPHQCSWKARQAITITPCQYIGPDLPKIESSPLVGLGLNPRSCTSLAWFSLSHITHCFLIIFAPLIFISCLQLFMDICGLRPTKF